MTYNVRHGECSSLAAVASAAAAFRPDVLAIQELDRGTVRSRGADQPAELARALGLAPVFVRTTGFDGGDYGHALFSRFPILSQEVVPLPFTEEPRSLLRLRLAAPGGALEIASVHLGLDARLRLRQAELIRRRLAGRPRLLLLGDLNEEPTGPVQRELRGSLRDCHGELGEAEGWTFPAPTPTKRIDFIYRSPDLPPPGSAGRLDERLLSDHLPVWAVW